MPIDSWLNELPDDSLFHDLAHNEAAFRLLFRSHFMPLCVYCRSRYYFDIDQAKEAVHLAFIKLWKTRHALAGEVAVKAHLDKTASNTCIYIIRHRNVKRKYEKWVQDNHSEADFACDFNASDTKALKEAIDRAMLPLGQIQIIANPK